MGANVCVRAELLFEQVFDLQTGGLVDELPVASDTVNGCDLHPSANLLAVSTGASLAFSQGLPRME